MNKSALALAGFGFAAGIVLFIVVQPLLAPGPKEPLEPQLAAMVTAKPTASTPPAETFPDARRACTLKAAERLPSIPGLVIKQTRTAVLPTPANWKNETPPVRVEVDIFAAGQAGTYAYLCLNSRALTVVEPLAN